MGDLKGFRSIFIVVLTFFQLMSTAVSAEVNTYPNLNAETAVLMDATTGQVLFEKNMHEKRYPASITKIMTGMLALEKGNLADTVIMSHEAVFSIGRNSSHIALDVEEELTLEQALYAIAIASGNDAANGIAEHISGSLENFGRLMNEKAIQSGALNSNFVNAHGLPDENHYTTAYDMARIMMEAIKTPKFLEIFSEVNYQMAPTNKQEEIRYFNSRNPLINGRLGCAGIIAGKSGWTSQANHTLVTAAKRGDRTLIAVVMNNQSASNNHEDTIKLFDYGFEDFLRIIIDIADVKATIQELNLTEDIHIKYEDDMVRLLHKNLSMDDLKTSYAVLERDGDETVQVLLSLNLKQANSFMYEDIGSILIAAEIINEHLPETEIAANDDAKNNHEYFLGDLSLLVLCLIIVFVKRRSIRKRNYYRIPFR